LTNNDPLLRPQGNPPALPARRPQAIPAVRDLRRRPRLTPEQQRERLLNSPIMLSLRTSLRMIVLEIFMEAGDARLRQFVRNGAPNLSPENRWFVVSLLTHENSSLPQDIREAARMLHAKLDPDNQAERIHRKMREELRAALNLPPASRAAGTPTLVPGPYQKGHNVYPARRP